MDTAGHRDTDKMGTEPDGDLCVCVTILYKAFLLVFVSDTVSGSVSTPQHQNRELIETIIKLNHDWKS